MSVPTIHAAAAYWSLTFDQIVGHGRHHTITSARAACAYVMRHRDGLSFPMIGRRLGGRDHSTIMNLVKTRAVETMRRDRAFKAFVDAQMALPKFSAVAARLDPLPTSEPPAQASSSARFKSKPAMPVFRPVPKKILEWERIGRGCNRLVIREDGMTEDDLRMAKSMAAASTNYIAAIRREHPERFAL